MKKCISLTTVMILSVLYGCTGNKNFFSNEVKEVDDHFIISHTLQGEKVPTNELYNISSLICFDEYLLALTPRANRIFNVLNFNGEIISRFGTIGRADDELMNCQFNGQTEKRDGHNGVWISDVSKTRMVLINIDKSIQSNKIVIDKEIKTLPQSVFCFRANDSLLLYEQLTDNNYKLLKHSLLSDTFSEETLYDEEIKNAFSLYKSIWRFDSNRNQMVGAMQSIPQINFYSVADQERHAIVIGEPPTDKNALVDAETGLERKTEFCDLEMTDSYIYALYMNQDYNDAYQKPKPQEVLIFDGKGNLDRVIRLNKYIIDITLSAKGEYLYGVTSNDEIYCYKLI